MSGNTPWIVALATVLIGPLVAYVTAARKLSGKVATSDASELWKESAAMRDDYRAQLAVLNKVIEGLRARLAALEADNRSLYRETLLLREKLKELPT